MFYQVLNIIQIPLSLEHTAWGLCQYTVGKAIRLEENQVIIMVQASIVAMDSEKFGDHYKSRKAEYGNEFP